MNKRFLGNQNGASRVRRLTTMALLLAVIAIFTFTPLGFVPITPISAATLMHIPVLVGLLYEGFLPGLLLGFLFGLLSLLKALTPTSLLDPYIINPLVSVLPRLLIPCTAWLVYRGLAAALKGKARLPVAWMCAAIAGSLTNTAGVLGMLYLLYAAPLAQAAPEGAKALLGGIAVMYGLPEAALAALAVPALMGALTQSARMRPAAQERRGGK